MLEFPDLRTKKKNFLKYLYIYGSIFYIFMSFSLAGCNLKAISCEALASTLQAEPSVLRELDLSRNPVQDVGVGHLSSWLGSPNCSLETLR